MVEKMISACGCGQSYQLREQPRVAVWAVFLLCACEPSRELNDGVFARLALHALDALPLHHHHPLALVLGTHSHHASMWPNDSIGTDA